MEPVVESIDGEKVLPKAPPKSIEHIDKLSKQKFLYFLDKYISLGKGQGTLTVSEKLDGSCRISFGFEGSRFWVSSKSGPKRWSPHDWPAASAYDACRVVHKAMSSRIDTMRFYWPQGVEEFYAEVLHTEVPNSIEYGPEALVIHGAKGECTNRTIKDFASNVRFLESGIWTVQPKPIVDLHRHYVDLTDLCVELSKEEPGKFDEIRKAIYDRMLQKMDTMSSLYGPPGGLIEGLVFDDGNGFITKLVNRDRFTNLNRLLWHDRQLLSRGTMVDGKFQDGIWAEFKKNFAESCIGDRSVAHHTFTKKVIDFGKARGYKQVDDALSGYILTHGLFTKATDPYDNHFVRGLNIVKKAREKVSQQYSHWNRGRFFDAVSVKIGNRFYSPHRLHYSRTEYAFTDLNTRLFSMHNVIADSHRRPIDTANCMILKEFLGPDQVKKIEESLS